jgi:hypothetical protein
MEDDYDCGLSPEEELEYLRAENKSLRRMEHEHGLMRDLIAANYRVMKADILKELNGRSKEDSHEPATANQTELNS